MAVSTPEESFKPALLVVDMQEDFCPPVGVPTMKKFDDMSRANHLVEWIVNG